MGTQFSVADINGDKLPDIILSNKRGTDVLVQRPR
ncbi:MAG TPA: FG-GAP repeat protein [Planctomycetaceae bacterium]